MHCIIGGHLVREKLASRKLMLYKINALWTEGPTYINQITYCVSAFHVPCDVIIHLVLSCVCYLFRFAMHWFMYYNITFTDLCITSYNMLYFLFCTCSEALILLDLKFLLCFRKAVNHCEWDCLYIFQAGPYCLKLSKKITKLSVLLA